MKNQRALIVMAIAVVLALAAVAMAGRWLLRQPSSHAGRIVVAISTWGRASRPRCSRWPTGRPTACRKMRLPIPPN
jgi:hypothetical protein